MSKQNNEFYPEAVLESKNTIEISVDEFARLKDIETRFTIMRNQMINLAYIPIDQQIIMGIEEEYKKKHPNGIEWDPLKKNTQKELNADMFPEK